MKAAVWLPIPGWEGLYSVSDRGEVRSEARTVRHPAGVPKQLPTKLLKPQRHGSGYLLVSLCREGKPKSFRLHILVLLAFRGPCPAGMEARHLDGDPGNPLLSNLAWGTPIENAADRKAHGTHCQGESHGRAKLTSEAVRRIRRDARSHRVIAQEMGVAQTTVSNIKGGRSWSSLQP
jgi:hypothetical protein